MLQKAMMPLGVDGGTRSSAAERMITYNTESRGQCPLGDTMARDPLTIVDQAKEKKGGADFEEFLLPVCRGGE